MSSNVFYDPDEIGYSADVVSDGEYGCIPPIEFIVLFLIEKLSASSRFLSRDSLRLKARL